MGLRQCVVAMLLAGGCGGDGDPSGYVLLDREARAAGLTIQAVGFQGAPALPMALHVDDRVTLHVPGGPPRAIAVRPGALAWVRRATGDVEYADVGVKARADLLVVDADPGGARALADLLGGSLWPRPDGRWSIEAPDVLDRASFLPEPGGVREAAPAIVADGASTSTARVAVRIEAAPDERLERFAATVETTSAGLVGVYRSQEGLLVIDAGGGFSLHCGQTRGHVTIDRGRVQLVPEHGAAQAAIVIKDGELELGGERFAVVE